MLSEDLARYVHLQRSLGFKFRVQYTLLRNFVAFAEALGDRHVHAPRVIEWAAWAPSPQQRRNRLLTVRRFAIAMRAEDWRHQIPADDAFGRGFFERRIPYIYTADEIAALMGAAAQLKPVGSIRPLMYETLFGLLAATGMRISEALALRLEDVKVDGLLIQQTSFKRAGCFRCMIRHGMPSMPICQSGNGSGRWTTRCSSPVPGRRPATIRSQPSFCSSRDQSA